LLDISRITLGKIELNRGQVDIAAIIRDTIELKWNQPAAPRHQIEVDVSDEPLFVNGDATRLQQILSNLLTNAIKFTDASGTIWVGARRDRNRAVITVRDSGIGIAPD